MKNHKHNINLSTADCKAAITALNTCKEIIRESNWPRAKEESFFLGEVSCRIERQMNFKIDRQKRFEV